MPIETLDDIIEEIADRRGVYGAHGDEDDDEGVTCTPKKPCRVCFACGLHDRIIAAVDIERRLVQPPADTAIEQIYQIVTRALAEPGADTGTLVAICTLIEGPPADTAPTADPDEHPCDEALGNIHEAAIFLSTRGWPELATTIAKAHEDIQGYLIRVQPETCSDCPPIHWPNTTRCTDCPRRSIQPPADRENHIVDLNEMVPADTREPAGPHDTYCDLTRSGDCDCKPHTASTTVKTGDELTGTADDSLSRGFVDAARNMLESQPAEPVWEWRIHWNWDDGLETNCHPEPESTVDMELRQITKSIEGVPDSMIVNPRKQWRDAAIPAGPWQDAGLSAAEGTKC